MGNIIWIVLLFFVLRFVFRYVLPVLNAVGSASRKMREMQNGGNNPAPEPQHSPKLKKGDYIEFEELK